MFFLLFCLMIEGSGSLSLMDPDADPGGPKTYGSYGSATLTDSDKRHLMVRKANLQSTVRVDPCRGPAFYLNADLDPKSHTKTDPFADSDWKTLMARKQTCRALCGRILAEVLQLLVDPLQRHASQSYNSEIANIY
jgi:hypothetical protein